MRSMLFLITRGCLILPHGSLCDRIHAFKFYPPLAIRVIHTVHLRQIFRRLQPRFAPRKFFAAVLALSLLTTFAPFSIYSSAHTCPMPCCASGSCSTGACDVSFHKPAPKPEAESHCEHGDQAMPEMSVADGITVRVESFINQDLADNKQDMAELCGVDNLSGLSGTSLHQAAPFHATNIRPQAFSRPCGPECCAGVVAFSQGRRSRELALLGHRSRPRAPDYRLIFNQESRPTFLQAQWRRQSTPRAPPFIFTNA